MTNDLQYVEQLTAHMDEGGKTNARNMRDLIGIVQRLTAEVERLTSKVKAQEKLQGELDKAQDALHKANIETRERAEAAEAERDRLREGMKEAESLLEDKNYLRYKADYAYRGHLSYHGQIRGREAKFRAALQRREP